MKFEFVTEKQNYEDYAAGRVILSQAGMTSFPVRLASEIFQQAYAALGKASLAVYDPCCGGGYLLTVLGLRHPQEISALYASDIDFASLQIARKNLALLSHEGLKARQATLKKLYESYEKVSHAEALASCETLLEKVGENPPTQALWLGNAIERSLKANTIDLLICDVPYGDKKSWQATHEDAPIYRLLEQAYSVLNAPALVVVISDKKQKAAHPHYRNYKTAQHGTRRISFLMPNNAS